MNTAELCEWSIAMQQHCCPPYGKQSGDVRNTVRVRLTNRTEKMEEISSRQIMCRGRERNKIRE